MDDDGGLFNQPEEIDPLWISTTGSRDRGRKVVTGFLANGICKCYFIVVFRAAGPYLIVS